MSITYAQQFSLALAAKLFGLVMRLDVR